MEVQGWAELSSVTGGLLRVVYLQTGNLAQGYVASPLP